MRSKKRFLSWINPSSKLLRTFLTLSIAIGTIVLLPIIILVSPFVFAWSLSATLIEKSIMKSEGIEQLDNWNAFSIDFSKWKNMDKNNG
jgi:hypothetical protein